MACVHLLVNTFTCQAKLKRDLFLSTGTVGVTFMALLKPKSSINRNSIHKAGCVTVGVANQIQIQS